MPIKSRRNVRRAKKMSKRMRGGEPKSCEGNCEKWQNLEDLFDSPKQAGVAPFTYKHKLEGAPPLPEPSDVMKFYSSDPLAFGPTGEWGFATEADVINYEKAGDIILSMGADKLQSESTFTGAAGGGVRANKKSRRRRSRSRSRR